MWGYQRGFGWENFIADSLVGLVILAAIVAAAVAVTLVIILCKELIAIFVRRAGQGTAAARILWIALAVFVLLLLVAALLTASPATAALGAVLAAWSFLAFVLVVEGCDLYERRFDAEREAALGRLDTYVGSFAPAAVSTNGRTPGAVAG